MHIIRIQAETIDIITALNNGVEPSADADGDFFLYKGADEVPEIMTGDDVLNGPYFIPGRLITLPLVYVPEDAQNSDEAIASMTDTTSQE